MADWMDELERLGELRDKGLLTVEEFEAEKENLLRSRNEKAVENETAENEASEIPAHDEKEETKYTLIITEPIPHEDQAEAITILRDEIDGLNYHGARDLLTNTPSVPFSFRNVSREHCETLKVKLERAGLSVSALTQDQFMQSSFYSLYVNKETLASLRWKSVLNEIHRLESPSEAGKGNEVTPAKETESETDEIEPDYSEPSSYYVELTSTGQKKINVIAVLRGITGWGLKEAKKFAESVPLILLTECSEEEALQAKKVLEMAGASVRVMEVGGITFSKRDIKDRIAKEVIAQGYNSGALTPIPKLKCPHCGEAGRCVQTHRAKFRQDTTREGTIFGSKTWQDEMNVECQACGLTSTIKGSSHYGI